MALVQSPYKIWAFNALVDEAGWQQIWDVFDEQHLTFCPDHVIEAVQKQKQLQR
jgi:hypothetical protein